MHLLIVRAINCIISCHQASKVICELFTQLFSSDDTADTEQMTQKHTQEAEGQDNDDSDAAAAVAVAADNKEAYQRLNISCTDPEFSGG